jgi:hypothetical protein
MLPALSTFNQTYQNRLRSYTIKEYFDCDIFTSIPEEQFGMIFAYDFLNHRPFEMIKKYFHEVYKKLKPGGTLIIFFDLWKITPLKLILEIRGPLNGLLTSMGIVGYGIRNPVYKLNSVY